MRRCVGSRNLVNEEDLTHLGAVAPETNKHLTFLIVSPRMLLYSLFVPTHTHIYTLKHQLTLTLKTLKTVKKTFSDVTPTCFGPLIRPFSGDSYAVLCAVTRLG